MFVLLRTYACICMQCWHISHPLRSHACTQVWDVRNHKCLQTLLDVDVDNTNGGGQPMRSMMYDTKRKTLVASYSRIRPWLLTAKEPNCLQRGRDTVCNALYNTVFHTVVTTDSTESSSVTMWDAHDGALSSKFGATHATSHRGFLQGSPSAFVSLRGKKSMSSLH